jgi:hypothetical protein
MHLPAYEDGTECSETSAYKIKTPGNYPEESIQHREHGESLKSRILHFVRDPAKHSGNKISLIPPANKYICILIYIQQDATLHRLFYPETALHISGGTTTHHQERIQLYLQHLVFVRPLLLSAAITADNSNSVTNTRCCRYSYLRSWWWVVVPPKTCRAVSG